RTAIDSYERAVQLDPNFALAWARLSRMHARLYFGADATATRRDAAKGALDSAQKLQPNSPETLLALGYYQYRVLGDYGLAKTTFGRVSQIYQVTARHRGPSALLPDARGIGMKALLTSNEPWPWTHVMWSYSRTPPRLTSPFDNSRPR